MTAPKALTRKAGPLPVWAWALVVVGSYLAYQHFGGGLGTAQAAGGTPVRPNVGSAAQQPASGQGSPADNAGAELLSALDANSAAADALLRAVQGGSGGGGMGSATSGAGLAGSGSATSSTTAPTVDSGTNNAPPTAPAPGDFGTTPLFPVVSSQAVAYQSSTPASYMNPDGTYSNFEGALLGWTSTPADSSDVVSRYLNNLGVATPESRTTQAAGPTPTVVQPAPVDTSSATVALTPRPTVGHNVAV